MPTPSADAAMPMTSGSRSGRVFSGVTSGDPSSASSSRAARACTVTKRMAHEAMRKLACTSVPACLRARNESEVTSCPTVRATRTVSRLERSASTAHTECSRAYPTDMMPAASMTSSIDEPENTSERNASAPPSASANAGASNREALGHPSPLRANSANAPSSTTPVTTPQVQNSATKQSGCRAPQGSSARASPFHASRMLSLWAMKPPISRSRVWMRARFMRSFGSDAGVRGVSPA